MGRADDESFSAAFDHLFLRCGRVAYRLLGDRWAAEDVAGEALARAYAHWPKINELPYRDAWVLRVATNLAIDKARRRARHTAVPDESIDLHLSDSDADAAVAQLTVLRFTLVAALAKLPRRQREIVVLRHMTGLSEVEVAAATGLALGTVKTHLRRGLMGLRRALGDETGAAVDAN
jgi:RNA polymerase sigma factor (sigma-70 family)